ncbi:MAG: DUF3244 domain-containing protein [Paludibacteraceae bacterium]|nr:DUF3244 domain-containing protein [Paludibacteraceae bacterium]
MRKCFLFVALSALLAMPCILRAEEVEIQLVEVIQMTPLPGDDPLDGNDHMIPTPTRPTDFRATINGNTLSIEKREAAIPSAQAIVVNAATGGIVANQQFTNSLLEQISAQGVYALRIETAGGALVGQFVVQ